VLALLAVLFAVGYAAMQDDDKGSPTASDPTTSPKASKSPSEKPSNTPSKTPSKTPSTSKPPTSTKPRPAAGVPAGYTMYKDPTGFQVAVPDGWQPEHNGTQVRFREPGSFRYLLVDQTDQPKDDAVADWENQEQSFRSRHSGYERIRIEHVDYRDYEAADWEFRFGNAPTHVLNRGMNTGPKGYALYFSSPESSWDESESIRQTVFKTFKPAG
jgi:eukaryotic-like serine/threonine-protein kinase